VCESIRKLVQENIAVPACPELLGGLSIPREPSEIKGGTGLEVLKRKCKVVTKSGKDVTNNFVSGAEILLSIAKKYNIKKAVLKSRSPACGCGEIYDGSFSGNLIKGDGVACALLKINGIEVIKEEEFLKSPQPKKS
jgi:uncharacterized protein YbbK (DUF523 family)